MNDIDIVARLNALAIEPHRVWLSNMIYEASDEIARLRADLAAAQKAHDATAQRYNAAMDRLLAEKNALSQSESKFRTDLAAAQHDIERLKHEVADLAAERDSLNAGWPDTLVAGDLLTKAEAERDEALALLRECRGWIADCWVSQADGHLDVRSGNVAKAQILARLDAMLGEAQP